VYFGKERIKRVKKVEPRGTLSPLGEMERWFEDFFRRPFPFGGLPRVSFSRMEEVTPSVDIFEDKNEVVVKAEIPGMKKEDLDITLTEDTISIAGEKKKEEKVEKKDYYHWECSNGSFARTFSLPAEVETGKAKAVFKDGVLEVRIPKTAEAMKKEKKIKIE